MYETTLTGRLPGLDIEVSRRQAPDGGAEIVSISLRAVPDLASAVERLAPGVAAMLMGPAWPGNNGVTPVFTPWMPWLYWLHASAQMAPWMTPWPWLAPWMPELQPVDDPHRATRR